MRKAHMALMATAVLGTLIAGMPTASATTRLEHTNKAVSGSCTVWQDVLWDSSIGDGQEVQQGHASSANGHLCGYIQLSLREGGSPWVVNFAPPLWRSGSSGWAPLTYDGPGGWVKGCVTDYTTGSAEKCTIAD